jgi:hypothetical protein
MASVDNIIVGGARVFVAAGVTDSANAFVGGSDWNDGTSGYAAGGTLDDLSVADYAGVTAAVDAGTADAKTIPGIAREIGFTTDGIDLSFEPEYLDATVDQALDSVILFRTGQTVSFGTTISEATLENLAVAIGQATASVTDNGGYDAAGETIEMGVRGGALGEFPEEFRLFAIANGPRVSGEKSERVFEAFRGISVESVGVPLKRNELTTYPVSFRCLPTTSGGANLYMKIGERVY